LRVGRPAGRFAQGRNSTAQASASPSMMAGARKRENALLR
jgi:hypothetical protein